MDECKPDLETLTTAAEVLDALGGVPAVQELTDSGYKAVINWKSFNAFPPKFYVAMIAALRERGKTAPASLWRMKQPASSDAATAQVSAS